MPQLFTNNAFSFLSGGINDTTPSIALTAGTGSRFPAPTGGDSFLLTLIGLDGEGNENAWEIVRVTARTTDTLTVVRGQEGTTARSWLSGTRVELRLTAAQAGEFSLAYSWGDHGVAGYLTSVSWSQIGSKPTTLAGFGITDAASSTHNHDAAYLGISAKAADADKLDGLDSSQFIRADVTSSVSGSTKWGDIHRVRFGDDIDMEIFHSGGTNYIDCNNAAKLKMRNSSDYTFVLFDEAGSKLAVGDVNSLTFASEKLDVVGDDRARIRIQNKESNTSANIAMVEFWNAVERVAYVGHVGGVATLFSDNEIDFFTNATGSTPAARLTTSRDFLLNGLTTTPDSSNVGHGYDRVNNQWKSSVVGTALANHFQFNNPNGVVGSIKTTGSSTQFNTSSDYRLKTVRCTIGDALARIARVPVYRGVFNADPDDELDMFLAHEVQGEVPNAVAGEKDGEEMQALDHSKLVPLLWAAVQELTARVKELEGK